MKKELHFQGKKIQIEYSQKADEMAHQLNTPMVMEMQVYFSCMLGKNLAYYSGSSIAGAYQLEPSLFKELLEDSQQLTGNIYLRFNIVMTKDCPVAGCIGPPPVTDFAIVGSEAYVPRWLNIDFYDGIFTGEYGWKSSPTGQRNTKQVRGKELQKSSYL